MALCCRQLAAGGLIAGRDGNLSVRVGKDRALVTPTECIKSTITARDMVEVDLAGRRRGRGSRKPTSELDLHLRILRHRPDVQAVVHAHPRDVMVADLAGVQLRQVFGAYNIPASRLASQRVPVYPRSVLVRTPELGRAVAGAIGGSGACILRGHGIVTVGETVEQATLRALDLAELSRISTEVALLGGRPQMLHDDDVGQLPDLGSSFNDLSRWRHYAGRLEVAGLAL